MSEDHTTETNSVVKFPRKEKVPTQLTPIEEALVAENQFLKMILINRGWLTVFNSFKDGLNDEDIDLENRPDCQKDYQLVVDAIRSLISKYYGIHHRHQILSEQMYDIADDVVVLKDVGVPNS